MPSPLLDRWSRFRRPASRKTIVRLLVSMLSAAAVLLLTPTEVRFRALSGSGTAHSLSMDCSAPAISALPPTCPPDSLDEHNCRFWALTGSGYPDGMIEDHMRLGTVASFKSLSVSNNDGWGFVSGIDAGWEIPLNQPLVRRGRPPANHPRDPDFDLAVDELAALRPPWVVGHIRAGSSGHWGLPDPHPFIHGDLVFAHNGSLSVDLLDSLLTTADPGYLYYNPPEYVDGYIDSELFFMYLDRAMKRHPENSRAVNIVRTIRRLAPPMGPSRMNFIMAAGDTLYALRYAPYDTHDPVRFYPQAEAEVVRVPEEESSRGESETIFAPEEESARRESALDGAVSRARIRSQSQPSPPSDLPDPQASDQGPQPPTYWVVASQILGSSLDEWGAIPPHTLAVFVPGKWPRFYPVD